MTNDKKTISNQWHEVKAAAKALDCPEWMIYYVKDKFKTNDRREIYERVFWMKEQGVTVKLG